MRVSTPPMDEDTADGKPRAFFSSMTPPASTLDSGSSSTPRSHRTRTKANHRYQRSSVSSLPREWWEPMPAPRTRRSQPRTPQDFEFHMAEHLPTSPLCPANIRHKSGGTGMCVYHGRRRIPPSPREPGMWDVEPELIGGLYQES